MNYRVQLGIVSDVLLHLTTELEPHAIQFFREVTKRFVIDLVQNLRIFLEVVRNPLLELAAGFFKVLFHPLLHLILGRFILSVLRNEFIEFLQRNVGILLQFHVHEGLRVVVDARHLDGVKEASVTINFTVCESLVRTMTEKFREQSKACDVEPF